MTATLLPVPEFVRPRGIAAGRDAAPPIPSSRKAAPYFIRTRSEGPRWRVSAICPPDWRASLEACGGGFFHTPIGLRLATAPGEARFFEYATPGDAPQAIALASLRRCRFSYRPRHVEFATWPALRRHENWAESVAALRETLREMEIAEALIESFDADGESAGDGDGPATPRSEYRVRLDGDGEALIGRCAATHRRRIRNGERAGWAIQFLAGDSAREAIATVQDFASARAERRGEGFAAAAPASEACGSGNFVDAWGACTVGAFAGDELLSAAIIGWANRRAFYITGGSTGRGYDEGAAAWMHWKLMNAFRDAGGRWYNLGGVASDANDADDPSFGLHRFKAGFGAERSPRFGARWAIAPGHIRSHAAARWIARKATA